MYAFLSISFSVYLHLYICIHAHIHIAINTIRRESIQTEKRLTNKEDNGKNSARMLISRNLSPV